MVCCGICFNFIGIVRRYGSHFFLVNHDNDWIAFAGLMVAVARLVFCVRDYSVQHF